MIGSGGPIVVGSPIAAENAAQNVPNYLIKPVLCHAVMFQVFPDNTGKVYIGMPDMDPAAKTGLFATLAVPTTNLLPNFSVAITIAPNALCLNDFWVLADNAGEGCIVTYLVL